MNPKLIILSAFLSPLRSGAEACAEEVALRLHGQYDITIITARMRRGLPKRDMLQGRVPIVRVGFGFGFDKWLFPVLGAWGARCIAKRPRRGVACNAPTGTPVVDNAREPSPIVVHAILETFAGLALHFCKYLAPSAKRLLTLQTTNRSFLKGFIIRSADKVTAISSALVKIAKDLGRDDVTLIPNGIDLKHIPNVPEVEGRILFAGRLEQWKGVDTLLFAFAKLQAPSTQPSLWLRPAGKYQKNLTLRLSSGQESQVPNLQLRIVGEGSYRKTLERLADKLGISDSVTFTGFIPVPQVYKEFAEAEIFCGLSRSEALGNVFLEAQAAGCAVIGTQVGGIPDIVKDGETGLLVPPDDVEAAVEALKKLLEDEDLRRGLAQAGVQNARGYDWGIIAERYNDVYCALQG